jgi:integrase
MAATGQRGIDELPSGKFRVRVEDNGRPLKVPLCATLEDAIAVRDGLYAAIAAGQFARVDGVTAGQWGPTWLRKYRSENRSYRDDRQRFEMHVATAPIAQKPMATVEPIDIVNWLADLKRKKVQYKHRANDRTLGYATRKHCLKLVRRLFGDALVEGLTKTNPALGVRLKKTDADRSYEIVPKEWPLSTAEQRVVDEALARNLERHIVDVAMGSGLRQGEQWNLLLADVHVDDRDPHMWIRFGSKGKSPKNKEPRKVPLFGKALHAMREWLQVLSTYAPRNPDCLVFPSPAREHVEGDGKRGAKGGGRRTKGKVPPCWTQVKAALGRPIKWHHLRHTCATSLLCGLWGEKWRLEEVANLLGHSSTRTTEMYAHFLDDALKEPVARSQAAWEARASARSVVMAPSRRPIYAEKRRVASALRSRRSEVRILCGAPRPNRRESRRIPTRRSATIQRP